MKLRIGETARRAGLNPMTLKRLEKKGLLAPVRDLNGHRVYDETALDVLARLYRRGDDGQVTTKRGADASIRVTTREA